MTQEDFANEIGIAVSTWNRVLNGRKNLQFKLAKKAADLLGCDKDIFLNFTDDRREKELTRKSVWHLYAMRNNIKGE